MDTVLLVWALLYRHFDNLPQNTDSDRHISTSVCDSINRRWEASDQDVFIATVIVNPSHKTRPFAKSAWFGAGLVSVLIARVWRRLFGSPVPPELQRETEDYLGNESAQYASMAEYWEEQQEAAEVCDTYHFLILRDLNHSLGNIYSSRSSAFLGSIGAKWSFHKSPTSSRFATSIYMPELRFVRAAFQPAQAHHDTIAKPAH